MSDTAKSSIEPGLFDKRMALSAREVAAALGKKVGAIYALVHRQAIPFHKRGKSLVFIPEEIRAWLTSEESRNV
jgi:excisionase family DNA binding protein